MKRTRCPNCDPNCSKIRCGYASDSVPTALLSPMSCRVTCITKSDAIGCPLMKPEPSSSDNCQLGQHDSAPDAEPPTDAPTLLHGRTRTTLNRPKYAVGP